MYNDIWTHSLNVSKYINNPKYIAYEELLARKKAAGILPKCMSRELRKELLASVGVRIWLFKSSLHDKSSSFENINCVSNFRTIICTMLFRRCTTILKTLRSGTEIRRWGNSQRFSRRVILFVVMMLKEL